MCFFNLLALNSLDNLALKRNIKQQSFQPLKGKKLYKTKNPTGFKNLSGLFYKIIS